MFCLHGGFCEPGWEFGKFSHDIFPPLSFTVTIHPDSSTANAFVAPGGRVCVFSGLIKICKSEDELAAVIGHEVSHVIARHGAEKMSWMLVWQVLRILWVMTTGMSGAGIEAAAGLLLALPYSRKMETEADTIGLRLLARACYDPAAMISMFETLGKAEEAMLHGHKVPPYLRTHPETTSRTTTIRNQLTDAMREYRDAGCAQDSGFFASMRRAAHEARLESEFVETDDFGPRQGQGVRYS